MNTRTDRRNADSAENVRRPRGLWRDGKYLVVDLLSHQFPPRCVISNLPVTRPQPALTLTCYNPPYLEVERLQSDRRQNGDAKISIIEGHKSSTRVLVAIEIPLSPRWQRILHSPLGTRLMIGAVVMIGLWIVSQLLAQRLELSGNFLGLWTWAAIILLLVLGGFVLLVQSYLLPVHRLEERKLWIGGVHRDWLKELPEFVPSQRMIAGQIFTASGHLWMSFAVGVIFLGLVFLTLGQEAPRDRVINGLVSIYLILAGILLLVGNNARVRIAFLRRRRAELYPAPRKRRRK